MSEIKTIVLTGGPSGGKSTLQRAIQTEFNEAYCAPEVATILLSGCFPAPTEQHPWTEGWQDSFQLAVAAGQIALEDISIERTFREKKRLAVFDRGLLDGAAYLKEGVAAFEKLAGVSEDEILQRYDLVMHLSSSAVHSAYDKDSNPHRFEQAAEAEKLDQRIMNVWHNHPNRTVLADPSKDRRISEGLELVRSLLSSKQPDSKV